MKSKWKSHLRFLWHWKQYRAPRVVDPYPMRFEQGQWLSGRRYMDSARYKA